MPCAGWPQSTSKNRSEALRQVARIESEAESSRRGPPGRPRPAGRRARRRRALPLLRQPLLPARRPRRGDRGAAARRPRRPQRPRGRCWRWPRRLRRPGRTVEAIELDWRAFEKTEDVAGKRAIVSALATLVPVGQPVRPPARAAGTPAARPGPCPGTAEGLHPLHRPGPPGRRRPRHGPPRAGAAARRAAGGRDASCSSSPALAEKEWDLTAALGFQRQLAKVAPRGAPGPPGVAALAARRGGRGAGDLAARGGGGPGNAPAAGSDRQPALLRADRAGAAADRPRPARPPPGLGGPLPRRGRAGRLEAPDEAAQRFQAILDLQRPDDELSVLIAPSAGSGSASKIRTRDAEDAVFDRLEVDVEDPPGGRPRSPRPSAQDVLDPGRLRPGPHGLAGVAPYPIPQKEVVTRLSGRSSAPAARRAVPICAAGGTGSTSTVSWATIARPARRRGCWSRRARPRRNDCSSIYLVDPIDLRRSLA